MMKPPPTMKPFPAILTVGELSAYLRIHQSTVYHRLIRLEGLPCFKVGSDWRFVRADVDRWRRQRQIADSGFDLWE